MYIYIYSLKDFKSIYATLYIYVYNSYISISIYIYIYIHTYIYAALYVYRYFYYVHLFLENSSIFSHYFFTDVFSITYTTTHSKKLHSLKTSA